MKHISLCFAVLILLGSACKRNAGQEAERPAPKTVEEYTQAIIKEVQKGILSTDQQLREYQPQRLELPAGEGQAKRILQLWTEEGNPVKLVATTAADNGQPQERSTFYFANGALFFATQAGARYIFVGPALKYWLDDNWHPVAVPEASRVKQEQALPALAEGYLELFEIKN